MFKHKTSLYWWTGVLLIVVVLAIRIALFHVVTSDYTYFVAQWFETLKTHPGLTAFSYPFSDYAPLYLYLLKVLTLLPAPALYSVKFFTLLCDAAMGAVVYAIVRRTRPHWSEAQAFLCGAVIFSIPTVIVNSSLWGQSDVLYALPIVAALYFMCIGEPFLAALCFGGALAMKLQAIFFLPVIAGYLLRRRETQSYLLAVPAIYILSIVPAWLGGGSPRGLLLVYVKQGSEYTALSVSAQNAFAFVGSAVAPAAEQGLFWLGIAAASAVACAICYGVYAAKRLTPERLVPLILLCVLALPYLLPRMHERYFYLADVFSVLYAFYFPRRFFMPILVVAASLLSYLPYLSSQVSWLAGLHIDLRIPSAMVLVALSVSAVRLFASHRSQETAASLPQPRVVS